MTPVEKNPGFPEHIAIILDGNSRWARKHGLETHQGHRKGVETVETVLDHAADRGVKVVTLYAFSKENWRRSEQEKTILFDLMVWFFKTRLAKIIAKNARIVILGDRSDFSADIRKVLEDAETRSATNTGCRVQIALSYGGRDEIVRAAKRLAEDARHGRLDPAALTEDSFKDYLDTGRGFSDPDLLIRTGGDLRVSNFLLYQIAYAELYFTPVLWPDFTPADLDAAIAAYQGRERRFGGRP